MVFNSESLKTMAVKVVSEYAAQQVPLSDGIAAIAAEHKLNSNQIKRLIEVSNQVAYLRLLQEATDRTFEFPLASYEEVMKVILDTEDMSKEASFNTPSRGPMDIVTSEDMHKEASDTEFKSSMSDQEALAYLNKQIYVARRELEKLANEEVTLLKDLQDPIPSLREDPLFLEKVAHITEEEEGDTLVKMSRLVMESEVGDLKDELFYESDLEEVRDFVGMYKRANEVLEERRSLEDIIERAEAVLHKRASIDKIKEKAQNVGARVAKVPGLAFKNTERVLFVGDEYRRNKRDVWKSLRG